MTTTTRRGIGFVLAVIVASLWASVVQTQFNLAALVELGASVPAGVRWQTTLHDIAGFGPLFAAVASVAFALAFALAAGLARRAPRARGVLLTLAGWLGLIVAVRLIDAFVPPPVLIAATRSIVGLLAMTAGGALAGGLFARVAASPRR
jgi:hypothetical protein